MILSWDSPSDAYLALRFVEVVILNALSDPQISQPSRSELSARHLIQIPQRPTPTSFQQSPNLCVAEPPCVHSSHRDFVNHDSHHQTSSRLSGRWSSPERGAGPAGDLTRSRNLRCKRSVAIGKRTRPSRKLAGLPVSEAKLFAFYCPDKEVLRRLFSGNRSREQGIVQRHWMDVCAIPNLRTDGT